VVHRKIETIYVGIDFWAQGEFCEEFLFLHCDVYDKKLKTLRKIKEMLAEFKIEIAKFGYDKPLFTYTQNPRWVKLLGATFHNSFEFEGRYFEVWKWELKP